MSKRREFCGDIKECFQCGRRLTCQAVDSLGMCCFKKMVRDDFACSRHGNAKTYQKKGQILVECKWCAKENGDDGITLIFDKNITKDSCGCDMWCKFSEREGLQTRFCSNKVDGVFSTRKDYCSKHTKLEN